MEASDKLLETSISLLFKLFQLPMNCTTIQSFLPMKICQMPWNIKDMHGPYHFLVYHSSESSDE